MINYGKHFIDKNDIKAVVSVLKKKALTQGKVTDLFEKKLKEYFGSKYAVAVSSGTSGLNLIANCLKWKKDDIIFCSPITFAAGSNCIVNQGAKPFFIDIDPNTFNLNFNLVEKALQNKNIRKNAKAIIATDFGGNPCDWKLARKISNKYNLKLINDNCHAIGSSYDMKKNYASKYADFVVHSYHAVKNFTTGEGGAILTNNLNFSKKAKLLRNHGIESFSLKKNSHPRAMLDLGYNYRLPDILCSLGISQLSRLNKFIKKRNQIANLYRKKLKGLENIKMQNIDKNDFSSYHLFSVLIDFQKLKKTREELFDFFYKNNIKLQIHYLPIYKHTFYKKKFKINEKNFPNTEKFYKQQVSLPIYYDLKISEARKVINKIEQFFFR